MERNGPYQTQMTWKIPCFSIADDFKSRSSSLKAKYALHRNIMYSIREICLVFKALKQNSPFQARMTWFILRSSPLFRLNGAYAEKLDAAYVKCGSFLKLWNKNDSFQGLITWNIPCSSTHEVKSRFALACAVYTEYAFFVMPWNEVRYWIR